MALEAVANRILDVVKVFMIGDSTSNVNFFDIKYQMQLNVFADLATGVGDLAYYEHMQQYLSMIDLKLTGRLKYNLVDTVVHCLSLVIYVMVVI